jgi:RNA polymerase sigma-70 factor (ECF subfamily)
MYVFESLPHQQIAEMLEISENTSKTQLMKARNKLKQMVLAEMATKNISVKS